VTIQLINEESPNGGSSNF